MKDIVGAKQLKTSLKSERKQKESSVVFCARADWFGKVACVQLSLDTQKAIVALFAILINIIHCRLRRDGWTTTKLYTIH